MTSSKKYRIALCAGLIMLSSLFIAGCGNDDNETSSNVATDQSEASSTKEEEAAEAKGLYTDASNAYNTDADYKNDKVLTYDYGSGTI